MIVDDVTRHLAFAFNEFLERQKNKDGVDENKQAIIRQAKELISSAFDLPEDENDESLKVTLTILMVAILSFKRIYYDNFDILKICCYCRRFPGISS